jgi:uncharacterized protein (DUF1330 family)
MTAYVAARTTITDKEKYENKFLPAVMKARDAHGGKIIAAGYIQYLIGEPAEESARVTIIEFQDEAQARAMLDSPEMQSALEIAQTCMSNPRISIVPGVPATAAAVAAAE